MKIYCKWHPFQRKPEAVYFSPWRSVGALSALLEVRYPAHKIFINEDLVPREHYDRIIHESDKVVVCSTPQGPALVPVLISLAISLALSAITFAVTYLLRPKQPSLSGPDAQRHVITGLGNRTAPYEPVPQVIGKTRMFPVYPGKFPTVYTEIAGDDQYLRFYLLVSKGPVSIPRATIKLGETQIDNLQGVTLEIFEGKDTDPANTLFTRNVQEESLSVELTQAAGFQLRTTEEKTVAISVDWSFLKGLQKVQKDGDRKAQAVSVQIEYKPSLSGTWTRLTEIIKLPDSEFKVWARSSNSDGRTVTVKGKNAIGEEVTDSIVLNGTTRVEGVKLFKTIEHDGVSLSSDDLTREVFLEYTTDQVNFTLVAVAESFRTNASTTAAVRRTYYWTVPEGQYDVHMRRLTNLASSNEVDDSTWTAIRSFKKEPPFSEKNCAAIAGRIKASEQLNGIIDNLSCVPEAMWPVYDGSTWSEAVVTKNPAWSIAGILTGASNRRPVPLSQIDADNFKEFADWCDENNFTCNWVFDGVGNVEDAANLVAATGRGSLDNVDGKYVIVIDRQQTESQNTFTPRNIWDFEGSATYPDEIHGLRIGFLNENIDYAEDEMIVYNDGYNSTNATKIDFIEYQGVTNPDQIWKLGRFEMATRLLQFEKFEFSTDMENKICTRGDLVNLSHHVMLTAIGWGLTVSHEFAPTGASAVTIDSDVYMDPAKEYGVQIRKTTSNKVLMSKIITPTDGKKTRRLIFSEPLPGIDKVVGNMVTVGEWGKISQRCIIKSIRPLENEDPLHARLLVVPEAPGHYTADQGEIPPHTPNIQFSAHPLNLKPPTPTIRAIRSDETVAPMQDDGSYGAVMVVSIAFASGFNPDLVDVQARYRPWIDPSVGPNPHPWILTPTEDGLNGEIIIRNVEVILIYEVQVRSLNKLRQSLFSPWSSVSQHTVLGDTVAPDAPSGVSGQAMDRTAAIKWTNPLDESGTKTVVDFDAVEVYRSTTNDSDTAVYVGENSGQVYLDEKLTNDTTYYYWLKSRDFAGNLSGFHATQFAGLAITPAANVVINKAEARLDSIAMSSTSTVLSLNYTSKGQKVRVTARAYIDMATNDPNDVQTTQFALRGGGDHLDTYDLALKKIGPGYPGVMLFQYEDEPPAGAISYNLLWAGSTRTVDASDLVIFVEEIET